MRKFSLIIMICLFVFSCFSCVKIEKISVDASETVETTKPIISAELDQFLESKNDFLLLVSSETCSSCQEFLPTLNQIISDYQITVYQIEAYIAFPSDNQWAPYNYTPTFIIYRDGEVISQIDAVNHEDEFSSVKSFTEYLEKYVIMTKK